MYSGAVAARALAMDVAHRTGFAAASRRLRPTGGCLLLLHRVAPPETWDGLPNRNFYMDAILLGEVLDYVMARGWAVVTLDEALERLRAGRDGGRFVNVSIDDVYRDSVEQALPVFRARKVPVTLFVTTGIPDRTMTLWQAGLETIVAERDAVRLPGGGVTRAETAAAKRALFARLCAEWEAGDAAAAYRAACALNGFDPAALHERHGVDWAMLEAVRDDPCVEVGGHTVSHRRLSALTRVEAEDEIAGCRRRLRERLGVPAQHFAFPFGQPGDCGPREYALAEAAGYGSAATTRRGLVGPEDLRAPFALPRNTLNGADRRARQVETHLSGLGGLVARLARAA